MAKAPLGASGAFSERLEPPHTTPEPDETDRRERKFQQALPLALRKISMAKTTLTRAAGVLAAHPFVLGAALLFFVSGTANRSAWGFPSSGDAVGIGGADVEEVLVNIESSGVVESGFDAAIITSAGVLGEAGSFTEEDFDAFDEGLVTVPWTPVVPSGSSGRNVVRYTVREGDTLSSIAQSFNLDASSLAWSNNLVDPDSLRPGDILRVPPVRGVLHMVKSGETVGGIARRFSVQESSIIAFNGLPADGALVVGDELVVPGGAPPPPPPKPKPKPVPRAPTFAASQVPLGYYIAPTTGRNYGRRHSNNGVDIANSCGTPIYAAAGGTVTRADGSGWNGGYGDVVEIAHPNGTNTRYAHLSQITAWSGQVAQGQLIAYMGTTGRSTGCHLHFEVHGARNPLVR